MKYFKYLSTRSLSYQFYQQQGPNQAIVGNFQRESKRQVEISLIRQLFLFTYT